MQQSQTFSWYPGHINKAIEQLKKHWFPLLDITVILVDARLPQTSDYELLGLGLGLEKPLLKVYAHGDLAPVVQGGMTIDCRQPQQWRNKFSKLVRDKGKGQEILKKLEAKGRKRKLRIGVCGIPNVGKSTFINSLAGGNKKAKTGAIPGITRQPQFITHSDFDILDSPGVLPKVLNRNESLKLAICGLLPAKLFDENELASYLLELLKAQNIALDAKWLMHTGEINPLHSANFLKSFKSGKLGRINLDSQREDTDQVSELEEL